MPLEATIRTPLRYRDMDSLGHLNQSVYHELLEEGRAALFRDIRASGRRFAFVVVRIELDYKHEVRRSDEYVEVVTRVKKIGRTSLTLENDMLLPNGTLAATGICVCVAWDTEARGGRELTEEERELLS